jgi:hypothetical protein
VSCDQWAVVSGEEQGIFHLSFLIFHWKAVGQEPSFLPRMLRALL